MYWIGGTDRYNQMSDVLEYSPVLDKWLRWIGPNFASFGAGVAVTENGIYYIGGAISTTIWNRMEFAPISGIYTADDYVHMGKDYVNLTGNVSRTYIDMSVQSPGFTMNFSRTYNSRDERDAGKGNIISPGWTFGFQGRLDLSGNDAVARLPDGSGSTFRQNPDGSFTAKDARSTLTASGSGHVLTTKDQYTYTFNVGGYLTEMRDKNGNAVTITVDGSGKPTQVKDQANRTYAISYASNKISTITEPATGRTVTYGYDAYGRLADVTDPSGAKTYYGYTASVAGGYLASVKDDTNSTVVEGFEYYPLAAGETLPMVKKITDRNGKQDSYAYSKSEGKITVTDQNGRTMGIWFDQSLYPIRSTDAEGRESRTTYRTDGGINRYGEISSQTDRNGNSTYYERDASGNVTRTINPDGSAREYTYDGKNNVLSERDEEGRMTYYEYDAGGANLVKKAKPLDGTAPYSPGANQSLFAIESYAYYTSQEAATMCGKTIYGLLKARTDGEGGTVTYTYDANGYAKTVKDASNNTTTYTYNSIGWLKQEQSPKGHLTNYWYDKNGRLLKRAQDGGETDRYIYNALGDMTQHVLPKQYSAAFDTATYTAENIVNAPGAYGGSAHGYRYAYNAKRQLTAKTDPMGGVTSYAYDIYGNVLTETQANGGAYIYTYDAMNRIKTSAFKDTSSSAAVKLRGYDYMIYADGATAQKTTAYLSGDADTAVTTNRYDYAGRPVRTDNADGTYTRTEYYANGLPKASYDARNNATYYRYNGLNLLEGAWSPAKTAGGITKYEYAGYTYDKCGRALYANHGKSVVDLYFVPTGSAVSWTRNTYNANGTVQETTNSGGGKTAYTYDAHGNATKVERYTAALAKNTTEYAYNHQNKPTQQKTWVSQADIYGQNGSGTIYSTTNYTYDPNGNLLTETDPNNVTTAYAYDQMNRLTSSSRTGINENGANVNITRTMAYDSMGNLATAKDARNNVTTFTYDKMGNLTKTENALSGISHFAYDRAGRKTAEASPANSKPSGAIGDMNRTEYAYDKMGRLLTKTERYVQPGTTTWISTVTAAFEYDANGNVAKRYDALGWKASPKYFTSYTYDMQDRTLTVKDPVASGYTTQYEYDGMGRKTSETDARGNATSYAYDELGHMTSMASGSGPTAKTLSWTYDFLGNVLTSTDGNGNATAYAYNEFGKARTAQLPGDGTVGANTVTYKYTIDGKLASETDPFNYQMLYKYDNNGRMGSKHSSTGLKMITVTYKYDVNGNLRYETDGMGNVTAYAYDALDRMTSISKTVSGAARTSQNAYDADGNLTTETDWHGNQRKYEYDPLGRLTRRIDENGAAAETLTYDENGMQITSKDALGNVTTYEYDRLNRLTRTTDPLGHTSQTAYDANGNAVARTDGRGNATTYTYDNFNRLTQARDPDNNVLYTYAYDANDNMVAQTDGANTTTATTYNARNLPVTRTTMGLADSYAYLADGSLATHTDRKGQLTTYSYDAHGRLLQKAIGASSISYTYDANGNELTVTGGGQTTARTYDEVGRVTAKTATMGGASYVTTFGYDITAGQPAGWHAETTTDAKGNVTTKSYDKAGRLATVAAGGATTTYQYNANGATEKMTHQGGVSEEYAYHADGRLAAVAHRKGDGSIIEAYSYGYDASGNVAQKLDGSGATAYAYDKLDRLLSVSEPGGRVTTYAYNGAGDRSSETVVHGGATITRVYAYNLRGWLATVTETSGLTTTVARYRYDANGNQVSKMKEADSPPGGVGASGALANASDYAAYYGYDEWGNMVSSAGAGGAAESWYGGDGLRWGRRADGGGVTITLYEHDRAILELDGSTGAQTAANVYGNHLISRNGQRYLHDGQGSVTAVLDAGGAVVASYAYDAFGAQTAVTGAADNPYRYAGYIYDEGTGLYWLKSRHYDPETARFLSEDAYPGSAADPLSLNLYAYCRYNPLRYTDPTGHAPVNIVDYATSMGATTEYYTNKSGESCVRVTYGGVSQGYTYSKSGKIEQSVLDQQFGWNGFAKNIDKVNIVDYATSMGATTEYYTNKSGESCVRVTYGGVSQGYTYYGGNIQRTALDDKFGWNTIAPPPAIGAVSGGVTVVSANPGAGTTTVTNNAVSAGASGGGSGAVVIDNGIVEIAKEAKKEAIDALNGTGESGGKDTNAVSAKAARNRPPRRPGRKAPEPLCFLAGDRRSHRADLVFPLRLLNQRR